MGDILKFRRKNGEEAYEENPLIRIGQIESSIRNYKNKIFRLNEKYLKLIQDYERISNEINFIINSAPLLLRTVESFARKAVHLSRVRSNIVSQMIDLKRVYDNTSFSFLGFKLREQVDYHDIIDSSFLDVQLADFRESDYISRTFNLNKVQKNLENSRNTRIKKMTITGVALIVAGSIALNAHNNMFSYVDEKHSKVEQSDDVSQEPQSDNFLSPLLIQPINQPSSSANNHYPTTTAKPEIKKDENILITIFKNPEKYPKMYTAIEDAIDAYRNVATSKRAEILLPDDIDELSFLDYSVKLEDINEHYVYLLENLMRNVNKVLVADTLGKKPANISFRLDRNNILSVRENHSDLYSGTLGRFNGELAYTHKSQLGVALTYNLISLVNLQSATDKDSPSSFSTEGCLDNKVYANQLCVDSYATLINLLNDYVNGKTYSLENGILGEEIVEKGIEQER